MANKPLQTIKFPGLTDTYTVPQVDSNFVGTAGQVPDSKKVHDEIDSLKEDLSDTSKTVYSEVRDASAYPLVFGWFSGDVGGGISWNTNQGTKTVRTENRLPVKVKARISIQDSADYAMRVFVCVRGTNTILYKSNMVSDDVLVDPSVNSAGVTIGVNFSRKDDSALTSADVTNIQSLFKIYYSHVDVLSNSVYAPTDVTMILELGTLSATSYYLYDQSEQYDSFYKTMRTPHFLDVRECKSLIVKSDFDDITVVFYDKTYDVLDTTVVTVGTAIDIPAGAGFARFIIKNDNDAVFDHCKDYITVTCNGMGKVLKAIDNRGNSRNMTMCYVVAGQIGRDYSNNTAQSPDVTDTTGLLRLPPNYNNEGSPVPLIVYAHGSSDYSNKWQNAIRGQVGNDEVITYLVNEGYAVFDCYGHTEAADVPSSKGHTYGSVDCMNCYIAGVKRIMEVYNIRTDGVYVTGISSGGLTALNLAFNNNIPVLACAPLAPAISIFNRYLGYNEQQRKEYAWAMGFVGDDSVLVGRNGESPTANQTQPAYTQELVDYFTANAYRTIGYNPMWNGIIGVPMSTLLNWGLAPSDEEATRLGAGDRDPANWTNVCRICKTPIKIWIADDDHSVPPAIVYNFLTTLKNGQCIGEERRVPNGEGGHYAFTSSDTTTRASGKTSLGVAYTDIPIYWMEMVAFFRSF